MLGRINTVTITSLSLAESKHAWCEYLGYQVKEKGIITDDMADAWNASAMSGNNYLLLSPGSDTTSHIRFIEVKNQPSYTPLKSYGWNAVEILVADVDKLAQQLETSPFKILGNPENLSFSDDIRAMQVMGPSSEIIYLTEVKAKIPGFDLPTAGLFVDRPFITILGGRSLAEIKEFYQKALFTRETPDADVRVTVLSSAYGLPQETMYKISAIPLEDQCYIEADELPDSATSRSVFDKELPPGIAMVTFEIEDIGLLRNHSNEKSISTDVLPYAGRRAITITGPTDELIELIETK